MLRLSLQAPGLFVTVERGDDLAALVGNKVSGEIAGACLWYRDIEIEAVSVTLSDRRRTLIDQKVAEVRHFVSVCTCRGMNLFDALTKAIAATKPSAASLAREDMLTAAAMLDCFLFLAGTFR